MMIVRDFVQFFSFLPKNVVMLCPGSAKRRVFPSKFSLFLRHLCLLSGIQFFVHLPITDIKCCKKQPALLKDDFSKVQHRDISTKYNKDDFFLDLSFTFFDKMFA